MLGGRPTLEGAFEMGEPFFEITQEVSHEAVNDKRLVAFPARVDVDGDRGEAQSKPTVQAINWNHPQDADDVSLQVRLRVV